MAAKSMTRFNRNQLADNLTCSHSQQFSSSKGVHSIRNVHILAASMLQESRPAAGRGAQPRSLWPRIIQVSSAMEHKATCVICFMFQPLCTACGCGSLATYRKAH